MTQQPYDAWLSVEEVAHILKMDEETIRKWIRRKQLEAYKFGRDYRIRREDFDKYIKERAANADYLHWVEQETNQKVKSV